MTTTFSRRSLAAALAAAGITVGTTAPFNRTIAHQLAAVLAQAGPISIEYWHRSSGAAAEGWEALATRFNEEFADSISITAIAQGNIQELNQKVRAAAAGGGMPAALMGDDYDITQYAANDLIVPFDPYMTDAENGLTEEELADFLPNQIERHKLSVYEDQTMAFPQAFSAFASFWNVEALANAGFDGPPATWQEFPDHARAIAEANPGMVPWITVAPGDRFISVMKTYGVEWLQDDYRTPNFDRPEVLEIMTMWKTMADEGLFQVSTEGTLPLFVAQQSAYFIDSSANIRGLEDVQDFTYDGGMPPQGVDDGVLRTETYGPINCLPMTTDAEQLAGWLWLKWLSEPDIMAEWVNITSYFPAKPMAAESDVLTTFYTEHPVAQKMVADVSPHATILRPSPALTEVRGQITANNVNEVLLGRLSPEEGVQKLQAEAIEAIARALGE